MATVAVPPAAAATGGIGWRRALAAPRRWLAGQSLGHRFVMTSLGLLLVVQLASFLVIDASLQRHARSALPEQLAMAGRALDSMIGWRSQRLVEGARLLAADYGFRSAVQSNDGDTIASVLANHGERIGAAEVALLGLDFTPIAVAEGSAWNARAAAASVARLAPRAVREGGASEIAMSGAEPRQLVLVPLKAPLVVGWVVMYFRLPDALASDLAKLSATQLTLLVRGAAGAPWRVASSRLGPAQAEALAAQAWPAAGTAPANPSAMTELVIEGTRFGARAMHLAATAGPADEGADVLAVATVSIDEASRPPRDLQLALMVTTAIGFLAFGLGSAYNARRITTPLHSLAAAAERLGSGDTETPIGHGEKAARRDEVGELAEAFELMRVRLAQNREQIVQSEKLASIGQLAAGVAHEINNPIGFVFSNFGTLEEYLAKLFRMLAAYRAAESAPVATAALSALRAEIELDYLLEDIPALMAESRDGLQRVRKIVQDLKDFSHVDSRQEWESVDLHAGIDSTLNIVGNEIKYKAEVVKEYGRLPEVECLPGELNQVFMNLLVNAAHAIGSERGRIVVRTRAEAGQVIVEVADNGSGIAPQDLKRIFDPFFTTKPVGKGTGLGLSLSYGIVKKHGGRIDVESEPGRGTTFRVSLPVRQPGKPA